MSTQINSLFLGQRWGWSSDFIELTNAHKKSKINQIFFNFESSWVRVLGSYTTYSCC